MDFYSSVQLDFTINQIYFSQNFFMVALFLGNSVINFRSINITIDILLRSCEAMDCHLEDIMVTIDD